MTLFLKDQEKEKKRMSECMLQLNRKTKEPVPVKCGLDAHLALTPTVVGSQAYFRLRQS